MQVLSIQENGILLRLLFNCDSKSFLAIRSDFSSAFAQQQDRIRACCAALLLLEDSRALSTAQRLGTWYTLFAGWDQAPGGATPNPFVGYLVEVAGDVRRSSVERHLVLQLLQSYQLPQLDGRTPLDYAMSYNLPLTCNPDDLNRLRAQLSPGSAPSPGTDLDAALQAMKHNLMTLAGVSSPPPRITSPQPTSNGSAVAAARATHSSAGSGISDPSNSFPTTPLRPPPGIPLKTVAGAPSPPGAGPMSHPLIGDLNGGAGRNAGVGTAGGQDWAAADGSASETRGSSSGGGGRSLPAWLVPVQELLDKALQGPLMPAQQSVVQDALAKDPMVVSQLGLGPAQLPALVEHVPSIAVEVLTRLAGTPALLDYLAMLARSEMSLHSMEVVNRLTTCMELPTEFLHLYIANCIHSCEATADKYVQSRLVRLLCVFLQSLIRNRIVNIADLLHEVQSFCVNFSRIREAAKLFRLLKQIEAGGRLGVGSDGLGSPTAGNGLDAGEDGE